MNISDETVAVILCTYNGEKYIKDQLDSLQRQTHRNIKVFISDDGSCDKTIEIIKTFYDKLNIKIIKGPKLGAANNFIFNLKQNIHEANYFCFCDQDDIWDPLKIQVSLNCISRFDHVPAMYCSRTNIISECGRFLRRSHFWNTNPCFDHALCQSIAGGNTMLFNKKTAELMFLISFKNKIPAHDWLTYLLVTAVDGYVYYDDCAYIGYRQHGQNQVGCSSNIFGRLRRFNAFLKGSYKKWNHDNIKLLSNFSPITSENISKLYFFEKLHSGSFWERVNSLYNSQFKRHNRIETAVFQLGALFGKI